ncbi:MAG: response regulator [Polyangiales bacterium]
MRVLVVEDNLRIGEVVTSALESFGHTILLARTCAASLEALATQRFDLAVVDIGLPDGSGLDVCRQSRANGHDLPILLLTARNGVDDRIEGLDAGADDYLGKPFALAELAARVRALGRRGARFSEPSRRYGTLVIDRERRVVTADGVPLSLTPREHDIVCLLAWRDGRVVPRDEILEAIWGDNSTANGSSLEVLLTRIRRKLGAKCGCDAIRTVRQVGYAWALVLSAPA